MRERPAAGRSQKQNPGGMQNADQKGRYLFRRSKSVVGSEQGGVRPVLVVQNDVGNRFSPTIIAAVSVAAEEGRGCRPTYLFTRTASPELDRDSVVLLEQLRTIDRRDLENISVQ